MGETDRGEIFVGVLVEEIVRRDVLASIDEHADRLVGKQPIDPQNDRFAPGMWIRVLELDLHRYPLFLGPTQYIIASAVEHRVL